MPLELPLTALETLLVSRHGLFILWQSMRMRTRMHTLTCPCVQMPGSRSSARRTLSSRSRSRRRSSYTHGGALWCPWQARWKMWAVARVLAVIVMRSGELMVLSS